MHRLELRLGVLFTLGRDQVGTPGPGRASLAALLGRRFDGLPFHDEPLAGGPAVPGAGRVRGRVLTLHDSRFVCPRHARKDGERADARCLCIEPTRDRNDGGPARAWAAARAALRRRLGRA